MNAESADALVKAVDLIDAGLHDGPDLEEVRGLVSTDPRAAGITIFMLTMALRDVLDERAESLGVDPADLRGRYMILMRFEMLAKLADVPGPPARRRWWWRWF